ncbi:aa-domain-containing protein [Diaporthe amygdali]|uniref:aa-domain-containing protein n=1 Tax=Phomopsis amygdali TaxID=1214568 RepID=UPI0022FE6E07|nr:aa-domain-containing protein [Diaporthe amygdali]KAJ0117957.1 aa-domain-containing protein [Diaporthe amygdali]
MKFIEVKIRPVPSPSDKSAEKTLKGASRIYVSKDVLLELTGTALENGKRCYVEKILENGQATTREASLWASADPKMSRAVAQMSKPFQDACDFKLGDQVKVIYTDGNAVPEAEEVVLEDVTTNQPAIEENDMIHWAWTIKGNLMSLDDVFPGLVVKRLAGAGTYRSFRVTSVNGSMSGNARFIPASTKVRISTGQDLDNTAAVARPAILKVDMIQGLETQIRDLNNRLRRWCKPYNAPAPRRSCGLVFDGGHGTGKTMLVDQICETGWGTVHRIQPSEKLSSISKIFETARETQPSIVVMDGFEQLIDKDRSNRNAVITAVVDFLDKLAAGTAARNKRPKVLVLATCLDYSTNMPQDLMRNGRFNKHINLPLPDIARRRAILSSFNMPLSPDSRDSILSSMSEKTHAYNGSDLESLVEEVAELSEEHLEKIEDTGKEASPEDYFITEEMAEQAMQTIRPSAMHDINLKPPPVHWDDIGGQEEVKQTLQQALALSKVSKQNLLNYMSAPPKGFLLYGPPGCSKTMAAQALATESDLNFFAVKGAELLNMYVGESERHVRQLFQRAREAAPSIIFLDEMDSIGGQRSGFGSTKAGGGGGGNSGLNVLSTLLNEMQGFELLQDVLILAATNRPQAMDPALLRPGRFDKLIFVGPPDEAARASIFRNWLSHRKSASDIDVEELARETEGCSGAETVAICEAAGGTAFWRDHGKAEHECKGVTMEDLREQALKKPRMITPEMLEAYEVWRNKFLKEAQFA